jgi:hypothetical protein
MVTLAPIGSSAEGAEIATRARTRWRTIRLWTEASVACHHRFVCAAPAGTTIVYRPAGVVVTCATRRNAVLPGRRCHSTTVERRLDPASRPDITTGSATADGFGLDLIVNDARTRDEVVPAETTAINPATTPSPANDSIMSSGRRIVRPRD